MLVIRAEQMRALAEARRQEFADRAVVHLRENFASAFESLGEEGARAVVATAMRKGDQYQLIPEHDYLRLLNLPMLLRREFETSTEYRWVVRVLSQQRMEGRSKMDLIYQRLATATDGK
ncbi:MAG: hypothetical protein ACRD9L_17385 [Bryobacteraceae bacterium]